MKVYLDASVLVSMFTLDVHTTRARVWLDSAPRDLSLSDWTLAEFSSALAVGVRVGRLSAADREGAEVLLGAWLGANASDAVQSDDVRVARTLVRTARSALRASAALHLAVAQRLGDSIATFDLGMARAALDLGIAVEDLSPHP